MSKQWVAGWGDGLTGPTTVASMPFCGGKDWLFTPVSCAMETIALVPKQVNESAESMEKRARLIAAAPDLLKALELMLAAIPPYREDGECTIPDATIKVVNAAINKATQ